MASVNSAEISQCIERALNDPSDDNLTVLDRYCYQGPLERRMQMYETGIIACLIKLLAMRGRPVRPNWISQFWFWLLKFVVMDNVDDPRERGPGSPADICFKLGAFTHLPAELETNFNGCKHCIGFMNWCSQTEELIPALVNEVGAHVHAIRHIQQHVLAEEGLALLRSLSMLNGPTREDIREAGGFECVIPYLNDLTPARNPEEQDSAKIRRGFRAASIVARLAGGDETGLGPQLLRANPLLIGMMQSILTDVIKTGATGMVHGMGIAPHLITMDLLVIARSDSNKPLLVPVIPVLFEALNKRANTNYQLLQDTIDIFLLLTFDAACTEELRKLGKAQLEQFRSLIQTSDRDHRIAFESMLDALFASKPKIGRPRLFGGLFKKNSSSSTVTAAKKPGKHVMLSYNWSSKALVLRIHAMLAERGIKLWMDEYDMGSDLVQSIADAVENSTCMLAFVTAKYKDSGNCRKELLLADSLGVPVVYVIAEEKYKPDVWLQTLMGSSLYITCTKISHVKLRIDEIEARINPAAAAKWDATKRAKLKTEEVTVGAADGNFEHEILEKSNLLLQQVEKLQSQMAQLQDDFKELKVRPSAAGEHRSVQ